VIVRAKGLVLREFLVGVEVLVARIAVVMFVRVFLMTSHSLFGVERCGAALVGAFDSLDRLEGSRHDGAPTEDFETNFRGLVSRVSRESRN